MLLDSIMPGQVQLICPSGCTFLFGPFCRPGSSGKFRTGWSIAFFGFALFGQLEDFNHIAAEQLTSFFLSECSVVIVRDYHGVYAALELWIPDPKFPDPLGPEIVSQPIRISASGVNEELGVRHFVSDRA